MANIWAPYGLNVRNIGVSPGPKISDSSPEAVKTMVEDVLAELANGTLEVVELID